MKRILRETSDEKKHEQFWKALYEAFKGHLSDEPGINALTATIACGRFNVITKLPEYPKGLDLENFEIPAIYPDKICCEGGGDWQQQIQFALVLYKGKLQIGGLYEGPDSKQPIDEKHANAEAILRYWETLK